MTDPGPVQERAADESAPQRLARSRDRAWLGGVCAGLAEHLGTSALTLRAAFVVLGSWRLAGVILYFVLWLLLPRAASDARAPGLDSATRRGMREESPTAPGRHADLGQGSALVLLGLGLTWLVQGLGWGLEPVWLVVGALAAGGVGLVWWQADHVSAARGDGAAGWRRWFAPLVAHWTTVLALVAGATSVAGAIALTVVSLRELGPVASVTLIVGLAVVGLVLLAAPWVLRARAALALAREQKLVSDARADMAAHLHDSVLQTLALIQRQADDRREVVRLARRQERELRAWLYGADEQAETLRAALAEAAQEVEDDFPVRVESVVVGDCALTPGLAELVRAAREAMVNAAKHSDASLVDVYAEVGEASVEVFVRDRGRGFDVNAIAEDRLGIRHSILDRMERHHGTARIRSDPDRGTEVSLEMRR